MNSTQFEASPTLVVTAVSQLAQSPPAMHVLLVEDGAINRRFIELALSQAGVRVTMAENGRLGVEKAMADHFDAILMDMQMPVMDGYQAATRLRQMDVTIPIIALTGHATEADRVKCRQAGCTEHVTKPVDARGLLEVLNRSVAESVRNEGTGPRELAADCDDCSPEFRKIALDYLDSQRQRIRQMSVALQHEDFDCLAQLAHRVKGTAGTVGFSEFTEPADRLEAAAISADQRGCTDAMNEIVMLQSRAEISVAVQNSAPGQSSPAPGRLDG